MPSALSFAHLAAQAAIAADPDAPMPARLRALVEVVEQVSIHSAPIPEAIADAVDDLSLIDAAVTARRPEIVCAALHQLGPRADLGTTRRRVVRRLIASGAHGLALAGLALAIGDRAQGAQLAARDLIEHVLPRAVHVPPEPLVRASLAWLAKLDEESGRAVIAALRVRGVTLNDVLAHATDIDAAIIASRSV